MVAERRASVRALVTPRQRIRPAVRYPDPPAIGQELCFTMPPNDDRMSPRICPYERMLAEIVPVAIVGIVCGREHVLCLRDGRRIIGYVQAAPEMPKSLLVNFSNARYRSLIIPLRRIAVLARVNMILFACHGPVVSEDGWIDPPPEEISDRPAGRLCHPPMEGGE